MQGVGRRRGAVHSNPLAKRGSTGRAAAAVPRGTGRRQVVHLTPLLAGLAAGLGGPLAAAPRAEALSKKVEAKFLAAMQLEGQQAINAWNEVIGLDETNAGAWANRGAVKLQVGEWAAAERDLLEAARLDEAAGSPPSALVLNDLGNVQGALGQWEDAIANYGKAAEADPAFQEIAEANQALALFQVGRAETACKVCRNVLRRDPAFADMRVALTSFLWASGDTAGAEEEWSALCSVSARAPAAGGGGAVGFIGEAFSEVAGSVAGGPGSTARYQGSGRELVSGTLCGLYESPAAVANRWPPRCTAAFDAFLKVSRSGVAADYDGSQIEVQFA